ncbi:hypothetical protein [Pseudooceanicola nitratireducens]|uniref:hypothetical protein n=1 Tax=Pseudooceanicola nitratireducens TaxID=517719 RepID=UPI0021BC01EB|nr:hypothetical protein [Pseudooceanicola nitratireducens]
MILVLAGYRPAGKDMTMPKLIRLYIRNVLIGFGISAIFVAALIAFDVAGLRHLMLGSSAGWMAIAMMWFANGIVFAGVQFGLAVMALRERDDTPRGGTRAPVATRIPAPVRATSAAAPRARR